jgi:hypothetical protein
MAALRLDQTRAGAAGAAISTPGAQAIPRPGRYEIDISCVTMPVTLSIERTAARARWFDARASACIDRNEFGVTAYRGMAGRYLDMTIDVRCVRT